MRVDENEIRGNAVMEELREIQTLLTQRCIGHAGNAAVFKARLSEAEAKIGTLEAAVVKLTPKPEAP